MGGPTRTNVRVPPRSIADRQVVTRREPPPTAARYARRVVEDRDAAVAARVPDREARPHTQSPANILRDRMDRAPRSDRPATDTTPPARTSVFDRQALSDRVREDRDRQVREVPQPNGKFRGNERCERAAMRVEPNCRVITGAVSVTDGAMAFTRIL